MAGGKESPRQKMIGMMYLVLLAMLALNVSKDILNAFVVINDSLMETNASLGEKSDATMASFQKQLALDQQKVAPFFDKAKHVKSQADELVNYLELVKREIIQYTEAYEGEMPDSMYLLANVNNKDNYDKPTEILIGSEPAMPLETEFSAKTLKQKLSSFLEELAADFDAEKDSAFVREIKSAISLADIENKDGSRDSWETANFYHMPLAACVTTLSKLQTDVRNAEGYALRTLFNQINELDFKFDKIEAKVIPQSSYVLRGQPYQADIFLAAYSTTEQPEIILGDYDSVSQTFKPLDSVEVANGLGKLNFETSQIGPKSYGGIIRLKRSNGTMEQYPFRNEYIVAEPSLTVSATKMMVFYRGVENPVEISVPGIPSENIQVSISGGNQLIRQADGTYMAKIATSSPQKTHITVQAKMPDGTIREMGRKEFEIKYLPPPFANIGGGSGNLRMTAPRLIACQGIAAKYDPDFLYKLTSSVSSFEMSFVYNGRPQTLKSRGFVFTSEMKAAIGSLKSGTKIEFSNIKSIGPDGKPNELNPIIVTLE